ncbi:MAG: hypothetical protein NTW21_23445 [Verrucomicrobia bacterium]|nr:hypothetical protein [Verrucomicrobiota bacterium]
MTRMPIGVANSSNYWDGDYVGYPGMALANVGAYGANYGPDDGPAAASGGT